MWNEPTTLPGLTADRSLPYRLSDGLTVCPALPPVTERGGNSYPELILTMMEQQLYTEKEFSGFSKAIRTLMSKFVSLLQLIPLAEGWIFYALTWLGGLNSLLTIFMVIGFPVNAVFKHLWIGCDYLQHRLWSRPFTYAASTQHWDRHYPVL